MPTKSFLEKAANLDTKDILLVDIDVASNRLMRNQIASLVLTGSKMAVLAVAYDEHSCIHFENITSNRVQCYHDKNWKHGLIKFFEEKTKTVFSAPMHAVMLGRMMTSLLIGCSGKNVFVSDSDVMFYRDPLDHVLHDANIMISATEMPYVSTWGSKYFVDRPTKDYTLNNGLVYYRSNPSTRQFLMSLAVLAMESLIKTGDFETGFLQTTFNSIMHVRGLKLHQIPR